MRRSGFAAYPVDPVLSLSWKTNYSRRSILFMVLVHLMYASTLHAELLVPAALEAMLDKARDANRRLGITGMLLLSGKHCFQVIEGEADTIDALYSKIALDSRHRDVSLMMRARLVRRHFARWSMGEARADASTLRTEAGLEAFLSDDFTTASLGLAQANRLIEALQRNRHWQRSMEQRVE